ncbi:MAG: threonine synthase [Bryobacterales bacterium]|nr:threonine synthase [Bryobacterales bacterium]
MTTLTHLECARCGARVDSSKPQNLCVCGGPLLARYDLNMVRESWNRDWIPNGPSSMWRYAPVLPVSRPGSIVSLGEGMTPLVHAGWLGRHVWIKDEAVNPTGSFKARGLSCAISMCLELGIRKVAIPSTGNAASAMAAYAAAAGLEAHAFLPRDVSQASYLECKAFGAEVTLVDGLVTECSRLVAERAPAEGWFDLGALNEPYRVEGKKTMGYEVAEQFRWELPDAIVYPAGGGAGLIGMWKAFEEMERIGWIRANKPKMIAVQAEGCQPVVRAFEQGREECEFWPDAFTIASGLRVPKPRGGFLILDVLRNSGGEALAVSDQELLDAGLELASKQGILAAPEGAACVAGLRKLFEGGRLDRDSKVVIFNTSAGLKHLEAYATRFPRSAASEQDKLGGLITPR